MLNGTGCDRPHTAARLTVMLTDPGGLAVVSGTAAAEVARVEVRPPSGVAAPVRVDTVAVPAENLRRSGLIGAPRIYVALFPKGFGGALAPPVVEAFAVDGTSIATFGEHG